MREQNLGSESQEVLQKFSDLLLTMSIYDVQILREVLVGSNNVDFAYAALKTLLESQKPYFKLAKRLLSENNIDQLMRWIEDFFQENDATEVHGSKIGTRIYKSLLRTGWLKSEIDFAFFIEAITTSNDFRDFTDKVKKADRELPVNFADTSYEVLKNALQIGLTELEK
ncbi:hypothetical protein BH10PAT2_BH10PAT2_0490 [soil metagenome]